MKSIRHILGLCVFALGATMSFSGCEVFVDFGLKNSTYELYHSEIPGNELNLMEVMLQGYQPNNPKFRYLIKYYDNNRCTGQYYAADTLKYEVEGTWSLPKSDILRIKLDKFVDGDFQITKLDKITYLLISESNAHGLPLDPPTTQLHLYNRKLH
ncbi:MAG: hypothetical protein K9G41_11295 [Flavobacteriales bacterium]|nr:hypothetical protein [Flavobacteriales bacterium]